MKTLSADRVIAGDGATVIERGAVTIGDDGRITAVTSGAAAAAGPAADSSIAPAAGPAVAPDAAPAADHFPGCTILPGLVDLHVHVGYWEKKPDASEYDDHLIALFAAANLREALSLGVTALRDLGSRDCLLRDLQRAVDRGFIEAPRLHWANRLIVTTGGHSWQAVDSVWQVDSPWALRRAVREEVRTGATWVKLAQSGNFPAEFTQEELSAAVDEATRREAKVAVHASTPEAIRMCVEAGVSTIEHGTELTAELAELMAERGVTWVPTLTAYFRLAEYCRAAERAAGSAQACGPMPDAGSAKASGLGSAPAAASGGTPTATAGMPGLDETLRHRAGYFLHAERCYKENFARLAATGVTIATGTDLVLDRCPITPVAEEVGYMVELGLPPLKAIQAATQTAAGVLVRGPIAPGGFGSSPPAKPDFGTVAPGLLADLLVVEGNPAEDIAALGRVRAVYLAGRRVV